MKTFRFALAALLALALCSPAMADMFTTADGPVAIPDNTGAATSCQSITVPGGTAIISDTPSVQVTAAHSWAGDLTYQLISPNGTLTVMNRPGRNGTGAGTNTDFQNATPVGYGNLAPSGLSAENLGNAGACTLINGTPGCEDNYLPAPDATDTPIAGSGTDFADFTGDDPVGVWMLCVGDSALGDTGTLTSWSLGFNGMSVPVELQSFSVE